MAWYDDLFYQYLGGLIKLFEQYWGWGAVVIGVLAIIVIKLAVS